MKPLLAIFCCAILSHTFSQTPFIVSVSADDQDKFSSVAEVADGYIGTGYIIKDPHQSIRFCKIGFNGQVLWNKIVPGEGDGTGNAIVKTSDGGFAITGEFRSELQFSHKLCILKFDAMGSLQWAKQYDEGNGGTGIELLQTDDNGFLVAGSNGNSGYLIKTDNSGNFKWSKTFPNRSSLNGLQKTIDNNYILLGGDNSNNSISAIKVDAAGNVLWYKTFVATNQSLYGSAILSTIDGSYLITTYVGFIIKLDSLGNKLWSKRVNAGETASASFVSVIETGEKNFILAGTWSDYDNSYYLIKIDDNGALIWTKVFSAGGAAFYTSIAKLIATSDNGFLAVGDAHYSVQDGVFIKLDADFNTCEPVVIMGSLSELNISNTNLTLSAVPGNAVVNNYSVAVLSEGFVRNVCGVLPVNLVAFNAALQKNSVQLNWQTATETNTSHFNIQRSTNGVNFTNVGRVTATGNSNVLHNYAYSDAKIADHANTSILYYRLQTVDEDGALALSKIIPVRIQMKPVSLLVWPNPVKDRLRVRIVNFTGNVSVHIYDVAGKPLYYSAATTYNAGIVINTAILKSGTYLLQINAEGLMLRQKFTKE